MSNAALGTILPSLGFLDTIVQDNTLVREFQDALFPSLLYRGDVLAEQWEANLGDRHTFTRSSLLSVDTSPLEAGVDPTPENPTFEQWECVAQQWGKSVDTHMPSSYVALSNLFTRNAKQLGLNAGQTLNRVCRNKLFGAYLSGQTMTSAAGVATTAVPVATICGFDQVIVNGQVVNISAANPKEITIVGVGTFDAVAVTPADANVPFGPGEITLSAPATFGANVQVVASDAPTIVRAGASATIDDISSTDIITLADIREAVSILRANRVPPHSDGYYHVHYDPTQISNIFSDNEFQRLLQSLPDGVRYHSFAVGQLLNSVHYDNNESPRDTNSGTQVLNVRGSSQVSSEIFAETRNLAGTRILRAVVTGGGSIMEKWIDENSAYLSEGGIQGKIGAFNVVNNGLVVPIERVRYIIRAPQDRLQQIVSQAWSASLDFAIPSDLFGGQTPSRFKRAVVIESGTTG